MTANGLNHILLLFDFGTRRHSYYPHLVLVVCLPLEPGHQQRTSTAVLMAVFHVSQCFLSLFLHMEDGRLSRPRQWALQ